MSDLRCTFIEVFLSIMDLFASPQPTRIFDLVSVIAIYETYTENEYVEQVFRNDTAYISFSPSAVKAYVLRYSATQIDTLSFSELVSDHHKCCPQVKYYDLEVNGNAYCMKCKPEVITVIR